MSVMNHRVNTNNFKNIIVVLIWGVLFNQVSLVKWATQNTDEQNNPALKFTILSAQKYPY